MDILKYSKVDISQEELVVLNQVDFSVSHGEFIYLCGSVGSGKSSLLRTMYAELPVNTGEARIFDYDLLHIKNKHIPLLRRKIGVIFQDFKLLKDRSVEDNLKFVLKATGWKGKKDIEDQINLVLSTVGMSKKGYKWPHQLSGGEQQRIVIARALLNSPELIIADEPTGNLDPTTSRELMEILHAIAQGGTAVIMATHNLQLVKQFPGTCYTCQNGELIHNES